MSPSSVPQWPQDLALQVADLIHNDARVKVSQSRLIRKSEGIALVDRNELFKGQLLGKGAFSEVHEVECNIDGEFRTYAMKHLRQDLMDRPDNFRIAASELAVEAHMLASFDHPNIIKIRGWSRNGVASYAQGRHDGFFVIMDRLDETLDQRIAAWQKQESLWLSAEDREQLLLEKLRVCSEIASALNYLHQHGVIFRDLKPNNIGFLNGRVKLFDFGLSRELPNLDLQQAFHMSGKVGTVRYMAVEVACHQPYNVSADVYSWAMVCYEILTLQRPFAGFTREMHANLVCGRGIRPELVSSSKDHHHFVLPQTVQILLDRAWSQYAYRRPCMDTICRKMQLLQQHQMIIVRDLLVKQQQQQQQLLHMHHHHQQQQQAVVHIPAGFPFVRKAPQRNTSDQTDITILSMESLAAYGSY